MPRIRIYERCPMNNRLPPHVIGGRIVELAARAERQEETARECEIGWIGKLKWPVVIDDDRESWDEDED